MTDNVVLFPGRTVEISPAPVTIPAIEVLKAAMEVEMDRVIIIGTRPDGYYYIASSSDSVADFILAVETAKYELLSVRND